MLLEGSRDPAFIKYTYAGPVELPEYLNRLPLQPNIPEVKLNLLLCLRYLLLLLFVDTTRIQIDIN